MAADYIPGADGEFDAWQANFVTYAGANLIGLGLAQGNVAPIVTGQDDT